IRIPRPTSRYRFGTIRPRRQIYQRTEHAGISQRRIRRPARWTCRRRRRIALVIDNCDSRSGAAGHWLEHVAITPTIEITEDAVARAWREDGSVLVHARGREQAVPQRKEERFVLNDWTANARGVLIQVCPVTQGRLRLHAIICPCVGIQCAVADVPDRGASEFICSRTRLNLDLSVAAPQFGID